jgi:UDP-glucuronate 4-epimerase
MKVVVTGGIGFIGSHLCERLLTMGHEVLSIDNADDHYDPKIKLKNYELLKKYNKFENEFIDLCEQKTIEKLLGDFQPDVVFHLAAKAGVRPSLKAPLDYIRANITATTSLLEAMRVNNLNKIISCSSSSVYGERSESIFDEDLDFNHSHSFYATTKQCLELIHRMYVNIYNFSAINLRFFTVYGPRQRPDLAIYKFMKANLKKETAEIYGDGSMTRDYTYVQDIVDGLLQSYEYLQNNDEPFFNVFNLGSGAPVSINEMIKTIEEVSGNPLLTKNVDTPLGDVSHTYANISKAKKELGFNPKFKFKEGIKEFHLWIKEELSHE